MLLVVEVEKEIILPTLPYVMKAFHISYASSQLITSINFLGFALSCLICQFAVSTVGYSRVILGACLGFNLGSLLTCTQTSINLMILGRFLQGISGGHLFIIIFAVLPLCYGQQEGNRRLGFMNGMICLTTGFAPLVGLYLNQTMGWHSCFLCVIALSAIVSLGCPSARTMVDHLEPADKTNVLKGYQKLLCSKDYLIAISIPTLMLGSYLVYISYAPFLYQERLAEQQGPLLYTLTQMGIMFGFASLCFLSGSLCKRYGHKNAERFSGCISVFSGLVFVFGVIHAEEHPYVVTASAILAFAFQGLPFNNAMSRAIHAVPTYETQASSLMMFSKLFLSSIFLGASSLLSSDPKEGVSTVLLLLFCLTLVPLFLTFFPEHEPQI